MASELMKLHKQLRSDYLIILASIYTYIANKNQTTISLKEWQLVAAITAFIGASTYSDIEILEYKNSEGDMIAGVWDVTQQPREEAIDMFFKSRFCNDLFDQYYPLIIPKFNYFHYMEENGRVSGIYNMYKAFTMRVSGLKETFIFADIFRIFYCGAMGWNSPLFTFSPFGRKMTAEKLSIYIKGMSQISDRLLKDGDMEVYEVRHKLGLQMLDTAGKSVRVIGVSNDDCFYIDEAINKSGLDVMIAKMDDKDYMSEAIDYLRYRGLADDEIDSIVTSAFESGDPRDNWEHIVQTY